MPSRFALVLLSFLLTSVTALSAGKPAVRHSYLVMGTKTAIIDEAGKVEWEYTGRTRDGFVLPNGNVLLAYLDRVEEVKRDKEIVFSYKLSPENKEIGTTQRLDNGNTLITELGARPRLMEIDAEGEIVIDVPLQPETDNVHMQTRMARKLKNGNYLVPHLLAFALKEYEPDGKVVNTFATDRPEFGGRTVENWPFTAIRMENGHTVSSLTRGNKVVEWNTESEIVWTVTNDDVSGLFKDTCGAQRLANGHTVIGSHGAKTGISMVEITPEKEVAWTSDHPFAARIHHFQILTTNGQPESGVPMR